MPPAPSPSPRVLPWLDDFAFFLTGSPERALVARDFSFATLERLGISRNAQKGQPVPSQLLHDHLGYGIDSGRGRFLLTTRREAKLRGSAAALLCRAARHQRFVRARELASFAGHG